MFICLIHSPGISCQRISRSCIWTLRLLVTDRNSPPEPVSFFFKSISSLHNSLWQDSAIIIMRCVKKSPLFRLFQAHSYYCIGDIFQSLYCRKWQITSPLTSAAVVTLHTSALTSSPHSFSCLVLYKLYCNIPSSMFLMRSLQYSELSLPCTLFSLHYSCY